MTRLSVGPFNRVEGDLEVSLDINDGVVASARVTAPMYRGFETILNGRQATDALVYAPRICGICSVAQSVAASSALAAAARCEAPPNGRLAANLILATENIADHLTHFYLFFMPDFARSDYANRPWFERAAERFTATRGSASAQVLSARTRFLNLMGLLAGRWPHTLAVQPGGSSRALAQAEQMRVALIIDEFKRFVEQTLFADAIESVAAIATNEDLEAWREAHPGSDFALFLQIAHDLELASVGRGTNVFMSYGSFPDESSTLNRAGVWDHGYQGFDANGIMEDVSHAWLDGVSAHPSSGRTVPNADKPDAYTWCKAPRLNGRVVETGALARGVINEHPLALDLLRMGGGNVRSRVVARIVEMARILGVMSKWAKQLQPGEPYFEAPGELADGIVCGLTEAARGSLGHWVELEDGRVRNYQIISPTTWNFSPRDSAGVPGPLEQALVGVPVGQNHDGAPVMVQHVVRSFDPCMVCTVH